MQYAIEKMHCLKDLILGRSESIDEIVESDHYEYHHNDHIEHDLSVGLAPSKHLVDMCAYST